MPNLNPGKGYKEHRQDWPPDAFFPTAEAPGNIVLPETYSQTIQRRSTRVQTPNAALLPDQGSPPQRPVLASSQPVRAQTPADTRNVSGPDDFFRAYGNLTPVYQPDADGHRRIAWTEVSRGPPTASTRNPAPVAPIEHTFLQAEGGRVFPSARSSQVVSPTTSHPIVEAEKIRLASRDAQSSGDAITHPLQGVSRELGGDEHAELRASVEAMIKAQQGLQINARLSPSKTPDVNIVHAQVATTSELGLGQEQTNPIASVVGDGDEENKDQPWEHDDQADHQVLSEPQSAATEDGGVLIPSNDGKEDHKKFPCVIEDCNDAFDSKEDLNRHQYFEHADTYCDKCKLSFRTNDLLLEHKKTSDKHIACPECGDDFKTIYSLHSHLMELHPERHTVICPGCFMNLPSVVAFISHVESNRCRIITAQCFIKRRVFANLLATTPGHPSFSTTGHQIEAIERSFGSLDTYQNLDRGPVLEKLAFEGPVTDHALPVQPPSAIPGDPSLPSELPTSAQSYAQMQADAVANQRQYLSGDFSDAAIRQFVRFIWGGSPLRDAPDIFDTGCNGPHGTNPFRADFDANLLRQKDGRFACPREHCTKHFGTGMQLREHMKEMMHTDWIIRCPVCRKSFQQASSLICHFESHGRKCLARKTPWIARVMAVVSSGLLFYSHKGRDGPVFRAARRR